MKTVEYTLFLELGTGIGKTNEPWPPNRFNNNKYINNNRISLWSP